MLVIFHLTCDLKIASEHILLASAPRSGSGFGAAISVAVARRSMVLSDSASEDRGGVAASKFLAAASACVVLWSFAAGHRKKILEWPHQGCSDDFSGVFRFLGADHLALNISLVSCLKTLPFCAGAETRFWSCNFLQPPKLECVNLRRIAKG